MKSYKDIAIKLIRKQLKDSNPDYDGRTLDLNKKTTKKNDK